jgi:hypothetical protein
MRWRGPIYRDCERERERDLDRKITTAWGRMVWRTCADGRGTILLCHISPLIQQQLDNLRVAMETCRLNLRKTVTPGQLDDTRYGSSSSTLALPSNEQQLQPAPYLHSLNCNCNNNSRYRTLPSYTWYELQQQQESQQ